LLAAACWSLTLGISARWWTDRHNAHHAHTNDAEADPDLWHGGLIAFTDEAAAARHGWRRAIVRHQGVIYPGLLLFSILAFRVEGWVFALRRLRGGRRLVEVTLLTLNVLLWMLPLPLLGAGWAGIAIGSQVVAGFYFALVVAPNHKGMPVWTDGRAPSFLERQVLSSRNITSHPVWDYLFGGLNYQIEHHLFPMMPRANLRRARALVKSFCLAHDLIYEEVNPLASYRAVLVELDRIGRVAAGGAEP
jgi:fatty acid desaturase